MNVTGSDGGRFRASNVGFGLIFSSIGISFISISVQTLTQLIIVRYFGLSTFSSFAYWRNTAVFCGAFSCFGLNVATIKFGSTKLQNDEKCELFSFFFWSLIIVVFISLFLGVIGHAWISQISLELNFSSLITLLCCVSFAALAMTAAQVRVLYPGLLGISLERLIPYLIFFLILIFSILIDVEIEAPDLAVFLGMVLSLTLIVSSFAVVRKAAPAMLGSGPSALLSAFPADELRSGYRFFLIALSGNIGGRVPLLLSGMMLPLESVGQFALLVSISGLLMVPMLSMNMVIGPELSAAEARTDPIAIKKIIAKAHLICALLVICALPALGFGKPLLEAALGKLGIFDMLPYFLFIGAACIYAVLNVPAVALQMAGFEKQLAVILLCVTAVKICVGVVLGAWFGLSGFGFAEVLAACLTGGIVQYQFRRRLIPRMQSATV